MSSETVDSLAHGLAGGLSGLISMTLTYPLVTLSTKAQATKKKKKSLNPSPPSIATTTSKPSVEAIKGLYNGLESALIGITATNFVYYYFYELTGSKISGLKKNGGGGSSSSTTGLKKGMTATQSIAAGAVAGIISRVVTNPIWIANTRLTVLKKNKKSSSSPNTLQIIYNIAKNEGWKNLFSGLVPALFLVLNPIIQYTFFEQLKTLIVTKRNRKLTAFDALILGAIGKFIATIATYPYITLRSRMHLQNVKDLSSSVPGSPSPSSNLTDSVQSLPDDIESSAQLPPLEPSKPKGMLQLIVEIAKNEGILNFYNGLSLKLLQSILSAAFLFYFKEELLLKTDKLIKTTKSIGKKTSIINNV
ncbi:hypothetical protein CANARDRAFT_28651 [[Candida] arabinofermentans NRRL YB-2248]|uniref:Peroxisomal membrane protein PMP47B n=1 Tax=[Candida] arabinofermentans NRRL YB-2248 TaxID=983967 RepID=A0A1E4SZM7_9ASCO|nr:hypothetical protein CANARDRAFT_28651 [[Candida] arabinofermentans NRRL YB-2248]